MQTSDVKKGISRPKHKKVNAAWSVKNDMKTISVKEILSSIMYEIICVMLMLMVYEYIFGFLDRN